MSGFSEDELDELDEYQTRKAEDKELNVQRAVDNKIEKCKASGKITAEEASFLKKAFYLRCKRLTEKDWYEYTEISSTMEILRDMFETNSEILEILDKMA